MGTKRLIYKDDKKDTFHVYTPQELEQKRQIDLIFKQAISLYELALELLGKARTAYANRDFGEAQHWDIQAHECELRGRGIEEEALRKHLELLEGIGRGEGWEIPEDTAELNPHQTICPAKEARNARPSDSNHQR